jgi:hypothetical protein
MFRLFSVAFLAGLCLSLVGHFQHKPDDFVKIPAFSVEEHCNAAEACRKKEYNEISDSEYDLCIASMNSKVLMKSEPRQKTIFAVQQIECLLNEDPCDYLNCMLVHTQSLR